MFHPGEFAATEVIRLNARGWYVEKIAAHFNWTRQTVREVLHKWEKLGLQGLWELPGRGGIPLWILLAKVLQILLQRYYNFQGATTN